MVRKLFLLSCLFLSFQLCAQKGKPLVFYVGSYNTPGTDGIYQCSLDCNTGTVRMLQSFGGISNPSFIRLSPRRGSLYAVSETGENNPQSSAVYSLSLNGQGQLRILNKQPSHGKGPCHVDVSADGNWVAVASYGGGTIALYPILANGTLGNAVSVVQNQGSGPNKERQASPHAHSIKFSPFSDEVFSADLGTDRLDIHHLVNGKLQQQGQAFVRMEGGAGPRHFVFAKGGKKIFVINELNSTISVLTKSNDGVWELVASVPTLPEGSNRENYCADIHLSADGNYLYGSNRGHNSIVIFKVSEKLPYLHFVATTPVEGNWPRNFGISPDGEWLLVANQKSNNISVFRINKENGSLSFSGNQLEVLAPSCIEFY